MTRNSNYIKNEMPYTWEFDQMAERAGIANLCREFNQESLYIEDYLD